VALNDAGTRLGAAMRTGEIETKDVSAWIRGNLCQ
jgi:hypothetical protein